MPDSMGTISLDLVIKNKIEDQIEKILGTVRKSAAKLGESIEDAIEKPMKSISETAADTVSAITKKIDDSFDFGIDDAVSRAIAHMEQQQKEMMNAVNAPRPEPTPIKNPEYYGYDTEAMKFIEEYEKRGSAAAEAINSKISETVESIKEKLGEFEVSSDPAERMQQELDNCTARLALLQKKWQELSAAEPTDKIRSQLNTVESQIISTQNAVDKLREKMGKSSGADKLTQTIAKYNAKIKAIEEQSAAKIEQITAKTALMKEKYEQQILSMKEKFAARIQAIEKRNSELSAKLAEKSSNASKKSLGAVFGSAKSVAVQLGTKAVGAAAGKLKELGKSAIGLINPLFKLGNTLKNTFKRVFLVAGIYAAFRAIKDGLLEAVKADEQFSRSLNEVRANLSIAFTPIVRSILPALNTLMSGLASITRNIAGFIAGLFGMTYKQAAEATKKLRGVADEAKKAKLSTAEIDEMNILSDGKDTSSGSDSGIDYSNIDMSEPELPDWAERLKAAIKNGDWTGVGAILAERVNSAFGSVNWDDISSKVGSGVRKVTDGINGFLDNISWETLGDTLAGGINTITGAVVTFFQSIKWDKLGSGIAVGLNRAIKKIKWNQLGKALSAHIQALIDTLYSFVTTFDWSEFGSSIGEAVNGWFEGIDFGKAYRTISEAIKGLLDFAIGFLQTVNWHQIGEKLYEFLGNIDWTGIVRRAFELLGSAVGAWLALSNGYLDSLREYFTEKFAKYGGSIGEGLWKGILGVLGDVYKWIRDNIFKPFVDGFKKAFGIASPSKEMAILGGYIVEGLYNAVSDGIADIKEIFGKMLEAIKKIFKPIGNWFGDRWKDIKEAFSKADSWFRDKFRTAWSNITAAFSNVKTWFTDRWNDITGIFSDVELWFKERFDAAWSNIKEAFSSSSIVSWFTDRWNDIKEIFSGVGSWFGDRFQAAYDNVTRIFSGLKDFFFWLWIDISDGAKDGVNWIIGKLNDMIDGLNSFSFGSETLGGKLIVFSISHIPYLASGGLATAPTLAMVGDNRNAGVDPEVIAPLSKLEGMMGGGSSEVIELLKIIIELLKEGMNIELINYLFKGQKEFSREVLKVKRADEIRRG